MKEKIVQIEASKLQALIKKLKKYEGSNGTLKVGRKNASRYIIENIALADDSLDPKDVRTKRIVLFISGNYTSSPYTLPGSVKLKENLGYGTDEYSLLQIRLNKLVKEYRSLASVSKKEANDCAKVSDCVALVNKKTTSPTD